MFNQRYGRGVPRFYWNGGDVGNDEAGDVGDGMGGGIGDGTDDGTGTGSSAGAGGDVGGSGGGEHGLGESDYGGLGIDDPDDEDEAIGFMDSMDPMAVTPNVMDVYNNPSLPAFESHLDPNYEFQNILKTPFGPVFYSTITDKGEANIAEQDALEGRNWGDTQYSDGAAFPSMYDPAPPVVEPPVIDPITQPGPTISYEDSILFNFTPRERHSYLLNQINMGMEPTRGYTGPDGVYVDLTTVYPDIFNPDYVTFPDIGRPSIPAFETTQPMLPISGNEGFELPPGTRDPRTGRIYSRDTSWLIPPPAGSINTMAIEPHIHPITGEIAYVTSGGWTIDPEIYNQLKTEGDGVMPRMTLGDPGGYDLNPVTGDYIDGGFKYGGYVDDYRMNRGGIMDLREPHRYNRGGNVMRNIRDEQARVIGVQDDAADEMNRIRYHSGRDARDERFRVAARERDAREEMGRLRGEARYEDMRGRGPRAFGHGGGVASLAPVARNMFRKRRLPRAGMVV